MRFSTRVLLLQLATQACVVVVCSAVFLWFGVQQLRAEADSSALNIARAVAESPEVRDLVAAYSADPGTPDAADLRDGPLQAYATGVTSRTEGLFVVITDDHGIRLAHPNPDRLGEVVSTSFDDALAGREVVTWETGTLGESARAKVPVYAPDPSGRPIGEVSVGFERASVFDDLPSVIGAAAITLLLALGLGTVAALLIRRRLERVTVGVQPEELVALVQTQAAVLEDSDDGVIALDPDGVVRVCTRAAARLLALDDPVGRTLDSLGLSRQLEDALLEGAPDGLSAAGRILYIDTRPVHRGGRLLGTSAVIRDRTDLLALSERLDSVRSLSDALRVQRHEFANRLHTLAGLLDAGRDDEARRFLDELTDRGSVAYRVEGLDQLADPLVASFLGSKAIAAAERGVELRVGETSLLRSQLTELEDPLAVLGNLIDNAITAAAAGREPRWVEVTLLDDGDELVVTVADSGRGLTDESAVFTRPPAEDGPDAIHGHGIGLPLSREFARRRGGDVWVVDPGGPEHGAVFGVRMPGVLGDMGAGPDAGDGRARQRGPER
ncbi:histidine kinase [Cnuibacter physcomitrellae]|uniref:sensor histidine kinase n=1 Tax=Cnuibacter physcomitrellae TaxID=1619308 RepID=UPI00157C8D82|nr:sensor histidine kinase [Cnuibacter physcomitrellae]GGI38443.1 histidine kinase [Cnuibacter physcomitrellae]